MYALSQKLARLRVTDIILAIESRVECQIGELGSPTIPLRKRTRAYIIDFDEH